MIKLGTKVVIMLMVLVINTASLDKRDKCAATEMYVDSVIDIAWSDVREGRVLGLKGWYLGGPKMLSELKMCKDYVDYDWLVSNIKSLMRLEKKLLDCPKEEEQPSN